MVNSEKILNAAKNNVYGTSNSSNITPAQKIMQEAKKKVSSNTSSTNATNQSTNNEMYTALKNISLVNCKMKLNT